MTTEGDSSELVRKATDACLRLLAVRARSRHELKLAMGRKGYSEPVREQVLEKLQGLGYLDDARFARDRAAALLRRGKFGPAQVLKRLEAHGLEGKVAREALSTASGEVEFDARATARQVLERRGLLGRPLGPREHARAARLLLSRGFSEDVIDRVLGEPALDPSGRDD
jgi:regulatory protein